MKHQIIKILFSYVLATTLFEMNCEAQCPDAGLSITSSACGTPRDLKPDSLTCTSANLTWNGLSQGVYLLFISDQTISGNSIPRDTQLVICGVAGACSFKTEIKTATLEWAVQTVCTEQGGNIFSQKLQGPEVKSPQCQISPAALRILKLYPNPATREIFIDYSSDTRTTIVFQVYGDTGNLLYTISDKQVSRIQDGYRLDLSTITNGHYVLRISNGIKMNQLPFVVIGK